jgi:hypothetical protein
MGEKNHREKIVPASYRDLMKNAIDAIALLSLAFVLRFRMRSSHNT